MLSFPPRLFIRFIDLFLFFFFFGSRLFSRGIKGTSPYFTFTHFCQILSLRHYSFSIRYFSSYFHIVLRFFIFLFFLFFSFFPRHATYTFLRFHLPFAPSFYLFPRYLCVAATAPLPSLVPFASSKFRYCQYHKSVRCARLKIDDTHH